MPQGKDNALRFDRTYWINISSKNEEVLCDDRSKVKNWEYTCQRKDKVRSVI